MGPPANVELRGSKTKPFREVSSKNDMLTRRLTPKLQYILVIFIWMLCVPGHTKNILNFKKCSEPVSFLTVWISKSLSRYSGCKFLIFGSQLQKVFWVCQFLAISISESLSRHKWCRICGVQLEQVFRSCQLFVDDFDFNNIFSPRCKFYGFEFQKVIRD